MAYYQRNHDMRDTYESGYGRDGWLSYFRWNHDVGATHAPRYGRDGWGCRTHLSHILTKRENRKHQNPDKRTCQYCKRLFPTVEAKTVHVNRFSGCSKNPVWLPRPCPHCSQMKKNTKALVAHYKTCAPYLNWKADKADRY